MDFNKYSINSLNLNELNNKKVIIRVDFNIPNHQTLQRIEAAIETVKLIQKHNGIVILVSHYKVKDNKKYDSIPNESEIKKYSLHNIYKCIQDILGETVFINSFDFDIISKSIDNLKPSQICILENIRLFPGETSNCDILSRNLASLADIYINDAFSASHRKHSSISGITKFIDSYIGCQFTHEIKIIQSIAKKEDRFLIFGGSKVETKMKHISRIDSQLVLLGGLLVVQWMKNNGYAIGKSLDLNINKDIFYTIKSKNINISEIIDCRVIRNKNVMNVSVNDVQDNDIIVDLGDETINKFFDNMNKLSKNPQVIWNGPVGMYEDPRCAIGTDLIAKTIQDKDIDLILGGGDILACIQKYNIENIKISNGGGALINYISNGNIEGLTSIIESK